MESKEEKQNYIRFLVENLPSFPLQSNIPSVVTTPGKLNSYKDGFFYIRTLEETVKLSINHKNSTFYSNDELHFQICCILSYIKLNIRYDSDIKFEVKHLVPGIPAPYTLTGFIMYHLKNIEEILPIGKIWQSNAVVYKMRHLVYTYFQIYQLFVPRKFNLWLKAGIRFKTKYRNFVKNEGYNKFFYEGYLLIFETFLTKGPQFLDNFTYHYIKEVQPKRKLLVKDFACSKKQIQHYMDKIALKKNNKKNK